MADKSPIEWTDATWNPIVGCSIVSPGCTNCYAMKMAGRIEAMGKVGAVATPYAGTTKKVNGNTVWTGKLAMAPGHVLLKPLAWRAPRRIFVNSMGDLFHEDVPDAWIDKVFAVAAMCPQHTLQILTKRANRMRRYLSDPAVVRRIYTLVCEMTVEHEPGIVLIASPQHEKNAPLGPRVYLGQWPLPNVWLGVSAERQQEADERIPDLLATPASIRFVSAEPLLGPIDFKRICLLPKKPSAIRSGIHLDTLKGRYFESQVPYTGEWDVTGPAPPSGTPAIHLDWIIAGGESGPDARPMHHTWVRAIRDQCAVAGVPFFFKQWGAHRPLTPAEHSQACGAILVGDDRYDPDGYMLKVGKKAAGRLLDGVEHNGMPELREVPAL
ncbi:phage Gp37/Gp68 family protein [Mesorhizobium loti]|uniref:Uncharacterized protein n=1 Tax=Rhizobium loti TaxID=381 RepID=A0A6M7U416_RHILI|nr:phage Gp37/Gp68 family protein [Mesorhizobium loti]OBQ72362.1 hypothetical protein A8145_05995 [Mesorhizobium loti]QKC72034.1 phage Gp37/Gp68 family protein [Mesorhizobium loti]